jgi:hypothetical protein
MRIHPFDTTRKLDRACAEQGIDWVLQVKAAADSPRYWNAKSALSLALLKMLVNDKSGQRGKPGSDALIRALAMLMLEATFRDYPVPPALATLVRYLLCGACPELLDERDDRQREQAINRALNAFGEGEEISVREGARRLGVSPKIMQRWLATGLAEEVRYRRETEAEHAKNMEIATRRRKLAECEKMLKEAQQSHPDNEDLPRWRKKKAIVAQKAAARRDLEELLQQSRKAHPDDERFRRRVEIVRLQAESYEEQLRLYEEEELRTLADAYPELDEDLRSELEELHEEWQREHEQFMPQWLWAEQYPEELEQLKELLP